MNQPHAVISYRFILQDPCKLGIEGNRVVNDFLISQLVLGNWL